MLIDFFSLFISTFAISFSDENRMQTLLTDIELDVQELKCLIDVISHEPDSPLKELAKRTVLQMRSRLDALLQQLDGKDYLIKNVDTSFQATIHSDAMIVPEETISESAIDSVPQVVAPIATTILAEQIIPVGGLRQAMSLNDSFRFARELFHGDANRMNTVLEQLSIKKTLADALLYLSSELDSDAEEEVVIDFTELLKKYFN
ncbi:MAG: hypothetical protein H6Q13_1003 [Bacteroidetes bacterium]|nr:hypothetical protein [Bacteroidota bacterium]